MSERKNYNSKLVKIGDHLKSKRMCLGDECRTREGFISDRSDKLFQGEEWISARYLANVELGKNQISFEKFIMLSYALECDPVELFSEIMEIL